MVRSRKIKPGIFIIILVLGSIINLQAQNFNEWFNQKKTQTKYLVDQIVALQVYISYLEKGYRISRDGLNLIGGIKEGEFNLHKNYFNSLKTVNPHIMKYPKIAGILSMQMGILSQQQATTGLSKESNQFTAEEIGYIKKVFENLEDEAEKDLDELQLVITNGQMQMTDDERIKEIDRLYNSIQDKYSFSKSFSDKVKLLSQQIENGNKAAKELKELYGIQPQ
jgi:hypothetical protein